MAEGAEVDERVDFDDENYMEEMDDEVEEQLDEDGSDGEDEENVEENAEEAHDSMNGASDKEQSPDAERSHITAESVEEGEDKPVSPIDEEEQEKRAELLALPPHGSEVFIGGLPREVTEEDLRDLCDNIGDIVEVKYDFLTL
jgi:heterogeneous nuclear ribonucleoprotein R